MQTKTTMDGIVNAPETEIEQIEVTIEQAKEAVAKRDALSKLNKNKDFKKIFIEGYLKDEAVRLAHISGDSNFKQYESEILEAIKAISHFRQYCENLLLAGDHAEQAIVQHEQALDDIRAEADEEAYQ